MFSESTRIRPAWAFRPEVAMLIERAKSPASFAMVSIPYEVSAFSDGGLQQAQAAAVERGCRRVIHLVGGDLEHLVLQVDRVAGRPGLETALAVGVESLSAPGHRNMTGTGAHHRQRPHRSGSTGAVAIELRFDQIAWLEIRRVGIGDVFGK